MTANKNKMAQSFVPQVGRKTIAENEPSLGLNMNKLG